MGKGDRFIFTTIISATAHAKPFKANNSLNQSPLPRHRGVPLRRLEPPFQSIRAGKINLSPLFARGEVWERPVVVYNWNEI